MTEKKRLEQEILRLLAERGEGKTICPSEAARGVAGSDTRESWEPLMEPSREAAQALVAAGKIVVTQGGVVVDGRTAKGPAELISSQPLTALLALSLDGNREKIIG